MCGICGIYGTNLSQREVSIFHNLLYINAWRGEDSTGVLRVDKKGHANVKKAAVASDIFLRDKDLSDFVLHKHDPMLLLGHCRAATKGEVTVSNAHPFRFSNIIGVHNGTIDGLFEHKDEYGTDSEALYRNINDYGLVKGLEKSLKYHHFGAYALAFIDQKEGTLNFFKNDKRPLHFAYVSGKTTLVWSSDAAHLELVLEHMKFGITGWDDKNKDTKNEVWSLYEDTLYQIKLGESASSGRMEKIKITPETPVYYTTGKKSQSSQSSFPGHGLWDDEYTEWWDHELNRPKNQRPVANVNTGVHVKLPGAVGIYLKCKDGVYRTKEEEAARVEAEFRKSAVGRPNNPPAHGSIPKKARRQAVEKVDPKESDLSTLAWLTTPSTRPGFEETALGGGDKDRNRPQSAKEFRVKLASGCVCCGEVVDHSDKVAVKRTRWWNRDAYACGDCYENATGQTDWVRMSIDDDWTLGGTYSVTGGVINPTIN